MTPNPTLLPVSEPRQILINLIAGLSLADHMGDAYDDCIKALKDVGIEMPAGYDGSKFDGHWEQLAHFLATNHDAQTVWGTSLQEDDND